MYFLLYIGGMEISERIVASRRTDREISNAIGATVPAVWKWRKGETRPNIKFIAALAEALGCDPADLIPPKPR